jgi:multidrug efflux pump subunit AcrA (membrane-fusion protein)
MTYSQQTLANAMLRKPSPRARRLILRIATGMVVFFAALALLVTEFKVQAADKSKLPPVALVPKDESEGNSIAHVESMVISDKQNFLMPRSFTGVLAARQSSELAFKLSGRVEKMLVDQGDFVKKGQVLAELDKATLEANLAVLKAQRNAADSRLRELIAGPRRQTIEAAKAQLKEIESLRELARTTYERRMQLAASDAISKQDIDDARLQLSATEGRFDAQKQVLSELEEGTRAEQIDAQKAEVEQIDANIRSLNIDLNESVLKAPFDAIVARRMADEGTVVSPGATLLKVVEHAAPEAWVGVPPEMINALKVGDEHTLRLGDLVLKGKIKAFLPELDPVSRTQTIVFDIASDKSDQPNGKAKDVWNSAVLGQIVQLDLMREVTQAGYWIPMTALTRGNRGLWSAYVIVEDKEQSEREKEPVYVLRTCHVEIIQIDSSHVFVRGTLNSGDRIVSSGLQKLTPGQRVRIADKDGEQS